MKRIAAGALAQQGRARDLRRFQTDALMGNPGLTQSNSMLTLVAATVKKTTALAS